MTEKAKTGYADQARKRDIDFNGMREEAAAKAAEEYDKFEAATKGIEMPTKTWEQVMKEVGDVGKAREIFNSHPIHQALRDAGIFCWGCPVKEYKILDGGREAFIEERRLRCIETFAVLKDGKWYERGSMGWWGLVSDEKDTMEWNREFSKMLDELPDDTLLTVVDCHI